MDNDKPCQFFYNITGEKAQELLLQYGKAQDFLFRPSESNKKDITLSVHRGQKVTHVKIPTRDGHFCLPNGISFPNIPSLVTYVSQENVFTEDDGTQIEIRNPFIIRIFDKTAIAGCDRFFHPSISGKEAENLLNQHSHGTYLVRESSSTPGEYVIGVKCNDNVLHIKVLNVGGRYKVGSRGELFSTIQDLIYNYTAVPMFQISGDTVPLLNPLPSTRFFPCLINERIADLNKPSPKGVNKSNLAEEFDLLQSDPEGRMFMSVREGRKQDNACRNRYRNIYPYDHTRVKLKIDVAEPKQSDYINANYVEVIPGIPDGDKYPEFKNITRKYISTQGCLDNTIGAFWRMVWQENCRIIVNLTKEVEKGKVKCSRYWPDLDQELQSGFYGEITVTCTDVNADEDGKFVRRKFKVTRGEDSRLVLQFHFLFWDDYECPASSVQAYMDEVNQCAESIEEEVGPMIVHCSAGIGRTGTYLAIDLLIATVKKHGLYWPINVFSVVRMLREQRSGMVQTETQYNFIYDAVAAYINSVHGHSVDGKPGSSLSNHFDRIRIDNDSAISYIASSPTSMTAVGVGTSTSSGSFDSNTDARSLTSKMSSEGPGFSFAPPPVPRKKLHQPLPDSLTSDYVNTSPSQ